MIRTILVALDGSVRTPGVFAAALEVAERFDAILIPFRAITIPPEFPPAAYVGRADALPQHLQQEALREMQPLLENVVVKSEPPIIGYGQPWRAILHAAEAHDVDLIVLGSHGYHGVDRVLGTTAGKVANLAARSVLIVHDRALPGGRPSSKVGP